VIATAAAVLTCWTAAGFAIAVPIGRRLHHHNQENPMPEQPTPVPQLAVRCSHMSHRGRCILTDGHDDSVDHLYPTPATPGPAIGTVPPEIVNAIVRDPNDPRYPSQIGVYCDECGTTITADYLVSTEQTKAERLEVARAHLRQDGWICDERGDYCPACSRPATAAVLAEVASERARQDARWGEQTHPDGTGNRDQQRDAERAREWCQSAFGSGYGTWSDILAEEVAEANAERDPSKLRAELIQVAAVAAAWIEAIDRRTAATEDAARP